MSILTFDNHDQAYHVWKAEGIRDAAVMHVDAHHDLFEPEGTSAPVISDYLRWCIREGIAREVYWVVPEHAWERQAEVIRGHLRALGNTGGGGKVWFKPRERLGGVTLYDRPLTVCSPDSLPEVKKPLLLDIDADYLLMEDLPFSGFHKIPDRPWTWPSELGPQLAGLARRAHGVTVCYSISGGFTPLMWKHLGDDLAAILQSDCSDESVEYANQKRRMAEALVDGDLAHHTELREVAEARNPDDASLHYWRALAYLEAGDVSGAREANARAVELDPTYAHSFGCGGLVYEVNGDFDAAEKAFRRATNLNESDALGWFGLGRIALRRNDREKAREILTKAAALPDAPAEVHRELGDLAEAEGNREEALKEYRAYLRMAFAGRSMDRPTAAIPHPGYRSPFWSEGYSALARLYNAEGNSRLFANCYSQALRLTNPRLYKAAKPILRRIAGSKDVSTGRFLGSVARCVGVGMALGANHVFRSVRRRVSALGKDYMPSTQISGRICPRIKIARNPTTS